LEKKDPILKFPRIQWFLVLKSPLLITNLTHKAGNTLFLLLFIFEATVWFKSGFPLHFPL
jgi:hypothetical protein